MASPISIHLDDQVNDKWERNGQVTISFDEMMKKYSEIYCVIFRYF